MNGRTDPGDESLLADVRRAAARLQRDEAARVLPQRIAGFRIQALLGEGGMGVVYAAEQDEPRRTVALKLLRPGAAGPSALRRFHDEARVLARLQHPGIAAIHAAGTFDTPAGPQPFFAMERIDGVPLDRFVREQALPRDAVLRLFGEICGAVHHAHQKGVVHRDLKPANVLVDAAGRPHVLDFGVARMLDDDAPGATLQGQLVGTPAYMSPEQLRGDVTAIDVRSDVYSLGVLLYELLAGTLPHDVRGKPTAEVLRTLAEQPPRPLGERVPACRGDLATIVHKACAAEPDRRYPSADALAQDVQRFRSREPIEARPPTTVYRLSCFVRRNRGLVAAAALVVTALVVGLSLALWQMRQAQHQQEIAAGVNKWFDTLLAYADPQENGTRDLTLREAIEKAAEKVAQVSTTPEVEANVRLMLGHAFRSQGDLPRAGEHLEQCLRLRRELFAPPHADLAEAENALALLRERQLRRDDAIALYESAGAQFAALYGRDDPRHARSVLNAGVMHLALGRLDDAERCIDEGVAILRRLDVNHGWLGTFLAHQANVLLAQKKPAAAEACLRETLAIYGRTGYAEHPYAAIVLGKLGQLLADRRDFAAAEPLLGKALAILRGRFDEQHEWVQKAVHNLAAFLRAAGREDEAKRVEAGGK